MTLLATLIATLCAGIGSVWIAAALMRLGVRDAGEGAGGFDAQHLLSLAAGALLATAFMHLLPEAFEEGADPHVLFPVLLGGLVFFFLLDKAELWHHGHEHHSHAPDAASAKVETTGHPHPHGKDHHSQGHGHVHAHAHAHSHAHALSHDHGHRHGGWSLLTGDSIHCFGDGVLIASAFAADLRLGLVAALSVMAHEVPHHIGDLVVLSRSSGSRRAALLKVSLAGALTALGGLAGWWLVAHLSSFLPYFLAVASSSFIYVALADLIPQLQRHLGARAAALQVAWLAVGIALVVTASSFAHIH